MKKNGRRRNHKYNYEDDRIRREIRKGKKLDRRDGRDSDDGGRGNGPDLSSAYGADSSRGPRTG